MTTSNPIQLHALTVRQPVGEFFIASIPARTLVDISYADVRRLSEEMREVEMYLGIQRKIDPKRMKDLRRYVLAKDSTFPTSVILAVDERCAEYDPENRILTLRPSPADEEAGEAEISEDRIAKVLDGQHRIAAFLDENRVWRPEFNGVPFDINVAIFIGADISEQANIFATVNLAQTKVNRSLVYDLTELSRTRSPHRTCHDVAVALDSGTTSPFHERIKRLGTATPGRTREPLTQACFVESLCLFLTKDPFEDRDQLLRGKRLPEPTDDDLQKTPFRGLFLQERDLDIAKILYNYFSAIRDKWPNSWNEIGKTGNLLPRANAFKAFMKFLREDVYLKIVGEKNGKIPTKEEFAPFFSSLDIQDSDFTTQQFVPGSGGQSQLLKMLRGEIRRKDMLEVE